MLNKINVLGIIKDHIRTLSDASGNKSSKDLFVFYGVPCVAFFSLFFQFILHNNTLGIFVNFGAILIALLLSVLVLIFNRETEIMNRNEKFSEIKLRITKQLYANVAYAIIIAIFLVLASIILSITDSTNFGNQHYQILSIKDYSILNINFNNIITVIILYTTIHLFLSILMVVQRIYNLLSHTEIREKKDE